MPKTRVHRILVLGALCAGLGIAVSCAPEARPWFLGGTWGESTTTQNVFTSSLSGAAFTEVLIQGRTFTEGRVVRTATHRVQDKARTPIMVDFNRDGRVDPVVGYTENDRGIVQILLSYGATGTTQFASLTLDGGENQWRELSDVAVADIDNDGSLDLIIATGDGIAYLHHPSDRDHTHVLSEWGQATGELELIAGTTDSLSATELQSLIATNLGTSGADPNNYTASVQQGYTHVEVGDFNNDGLNDIAATRRLEVSLQPKTGVDVPELTIATGSLQVLLSPGATANGQYWTGIAIGQHERHATFDREGATDLRLVDMDGDGYLDLVTAAASDNNVQIAWFENPGASGGLDPTATWVQHRIGSIQGPVALEVADLTGDGRPDVVAVSPVQMQLVLFVQPEEGPARGYDWYTTPLVTFESVEPRSVVALDVDNDGQLELVMGGSIGAVRYFSRPTQVTDPWTAHSILTFDPPGAVGLLGFGDLDGDGDVDLVAVVTGDSPAADRVSWIRNELVP
jgi:hypothetical protein